MNSDQICNALNRMIAILESSLPIYLTDAAPWFGGDDSAQEVITAVATDQRDTVERLARIVLDYGAEVRHGSFPMEFTGFHDLSVDFLKQELVKRQQAEISAFDSIAIGMPECMAKSVAEEVVGAARGHLESLREISATPTML